MEECPGNLFQYGISCDSRPRHRMCTLVRAGLRKIVSPLSVVDTHREASDGVETGESGQQATGIYDILNGRQSVPAESPFR